jgi:cellulose synthase (UDP-forming)
VFQSRSKHGNYNAWFDAEGYARYDILVGFDPDHVPHPAFLRHALGYFDDPRVGYVQLPQVYYNQAASFIARGAAEETYSYYAATQMAAYAAGYPIVTGCHQCHRVTALKEVGGFSPHDADDLLITLYYRTHGWQGVYVPRVLAKGLTPVDWDGYLAQQLRWARSVLDIKFRIYPRVAGRLPLRERVVSFLHGFYYLQGLLVLAGVVSLSFLLAGADAPWAVSRPALPRLLVLWLALLAWDFYRQRFFLGGRREWGLPWRALVLQYAKWPYLLLALVDVLLNRRVPYRITRKTKTASHSSLLVWPHGIVALVVVSAWVAGRLLYPDRVIDPVLDWSAGFTVFSSLALILTARLRFPEPYDRKLWELEAATAAQQPSDA